MLKNVVNVKQILTPTEVDHYQIQRAVDIYVTPKGEDLGRVTDAVRNILAKENIPGNVRVNLRGMVQGMEASFKSFALGFLISFVLLFLILTAQFKSFIDPFLIMLAIPMGFVGVLIILPLTHSTLNVMSLMGVLMLVGIADSNSILIVDFAHNLERQGLSPADAVITDVPRSFASHPDDLAGDHHWHDSDGPEIRHRSRAVHAPWHARIIGGLSPHPSS